MLTSFSPHTAYRNTPQFKGIYLIQTSQPAMQNLFTIALKTNNALKNEIAHAMISHDEQKEIPPNTFLHSAFLFFKNMIIGISGEKDVQIITKIAKNLSGDSSKLEDVEALNKAQEPHNNRITIDTGSVPDQTIEKLIVQEILRLKKITSEDISILEVDFNPATS